jgi:hypothetical protein
VTWVEVSPLAPPVSGLAVDPVDSRRIAANTYAGVFFSSDRGVSWEPVNAGLERFPSGTLAFSADGLTLYLGTRNTVYQYSFCNDCLPRVESPRRPPGDDPSASRSALIRRGGRARAA